MNKVQSCRHSGDPKRAHSSFCGDETGEIHLRLFCFWFGLTYDVAKYFFKFHNILECFRILPLTRFLTFPAVQHAVYSVTRRIHNQSLNKIDFAQFLLLLVPKKGTIG